MQIKPFFVIICLYRAFGNGLTAVGVETEWQAGAVEMY